MKIISKNNLRDELIKEFNKIEKPQGKIIPFLNFYFYDNLNEFVKYGDVKHEGGEWKDTKNKLKELPEDIILVMYQRFFELKNKGYWDKII